MSENDTPEFNPHVRAALFEALNNQLSSPETPEVRVELDRLVAAGVKKKDAKEMMAMILACHVVGILRRSKPFDYAAYLAELRKLPEIDYDETL